MAFAMAMENKNLRLKTISKMWVANLGMRRRLLDWRNRRERGGAEWWKRDLCHARHDWRDFAV